MHRGEETQLAFAGGSTPNFGGRGRQIKLSLTLLRMLRCARNSLSTLHPHSRVRAKSIAHSVSALFHQRGLNTEPSTSSLRRRAVCFDKTKGTSRCTHRSECSSLPDHVQESPPQRIVVVRTEFHSGATAWTSSWRVPTPSVTWNVLPPVPLKKAVPPGDSTKADQFLRMSTLHIMCSGNKYCGFRRLKACLEQHFRAAEAFDAKKKFRLVEQPPWSSSDVRLPRSFPSSCAQKKIMELGCATGRHDMACKFMRMWTSHFVRRKLAWIPLAPHRWNWQERRLLNENVGHNDDVSDWELASLLLVSRSELPNLKFRQIVHQTGRSSRGKATRRSRHMAHLSARVSACTAGLKTGCLLCKSSFHHSNTVKKVSRQRAVSTQGQARRAGGHALGARYTAFSMIQGNGVHRVRRRRFEEARSERPCGVTDLSAAPWHHPPATASSYRVRGCSSAPHVGCGGRCAGRGRPVTVDHPWSCPSVLAGPIGASRVVGTCRRGGCCEPVHQLDIATPTAPVVGALSMLGRRETTGVRCFWGRWYRLPFLRLSEKSIGPRRCIHQHCPAQHPPVVRGRLIHSRCFPWTLCSFDISANRCFVHPRDTCAKVRRSS